MPQTPAQSAGGDGVNRSAMCSLHPDQLLCLVCEDCDVPVCSSCDRHKTHKLTPLADVAEKSSAQLAAYLEQLSEKGEELVKTLSDIRLNEEHLQTATQNVEGNLRERTKKIKAWAEEIFQSELRRLEESNKEISTRMNDEAIQIQKLLDRTKNLQTEVEAAMSEDADVLTKRRLLAELKAGRGKETIMTMPTTDVPSLKTFETAAVRPAFLGRCSRSALRASKLSKEGEDTAKRNVEDSMPRFKVVPFPLSGHRQT